PRDARNGAAGGGASAKALGTANQKGDGVQAMEADEIRVLAATAMLGSGFLESSFEEGLRRRPHLIGCDSGSTDGGPYSLGLGRPGFSRDATKRDLRVM